MARRSATVKNGGCQGSLSAGGALSPRGVIYNYKNNCHLDLVNVRVRQNILVLY